MWDGLHLAEHLGRAGLIESDAGIDHTHRVEDTGHAQAGHFTGKDRLAERRLHEALGGEIVDLGWAMLAEQVNHRHFVEQIASDQGDFVLDMVDALEVNRARTTNHADDVVTLLEQVFGQVGTVLAGNTGDECALFCHDALDMLKHCIHLYYRHA